jgi:hypothetical protein
MKFLEYIDQRRRRGDPVRNRETESVGLSRTMIRILPEDHYFDPVKGRMIEGIENQFSGWIYSISFLFLHQERLEFAKVGRLELLPEDFFPTLFDIWLNCRHGAERYQKCLNPATGHRYG